ncbi:MAG: glycosyltransferase family 4 protein, partial [Candidatus Eremiobacteraeota bacterium]|nr:glycosyltransferase family 4 protein [Candidatus Eremiobacteraeota bacterium]
GSGFRLFPPEANCFPWLAGHLGDYDGFHLHGVAGWARYAAALGRPFIASFRGSDLNLGVYRQPAALRSTIQAASACTFMNPVQQQLASRLFGPVPNPSVVPNSRPWVEVEPANLKLPRPILCCVNEFRRLTGLDFLLEAFRQLDRGTLLLVGPLHPAEAPYYTRLLERLPRVHRTGAVGPERVLQLLKASDVAVFPSVSEGMPNKVLEAMSVGVPVVASDVPGMSYLIEDGRHGRLFPSRSVEGLYRVLLEVLQADDGQKQGWTDEARRKLLEQHLPEVERSRWLECYRRLDEPPIGV